MATIDFGWYIQEMNTRELRLDWLRAFLAVVDSGGFTAAAARLHLSQPALHTQVKQLAAWAGPASLPALPFRGASLDAPRTAWEA